MPVSVSVAAVSLALTKRFCGFIVCSLAFFVNQPLAIKFFKFDLLFIPIERQSFENKAFRIKINARKGSFVSLGKQAERIGNREFLKKEWQVGICEIKNELLIPPAEGVL